MSGEAHLGSSRWEKSHAAPGVHILLHLDYVAGAGFINGEFWNTPGGGNTTSPQNIFPLKDVAGIHSNLGLKFLTNAWAARGGSALGVAQAGYPANAFHYWLAANTTTVESILIHGIPEDCLVDLVLGGQQGSASARGGYYTIRNDGRRAETIDGQTGGPTGPVMFDGIEPQDGEITVDMIGTTDFKYWSLMDMRVYRR